MKLNPNLVTFVFAFGVTAAGTVKLIAPSEYKLLTPESVGFSSGHPPYAADIKVGDSGLVEVDENTLGYCLQPGSMDVDVSAQGWPEGFTDCQLVFATFPPKPEATEDDGA